MKRMCLVVILLIVLIGAGCSTTNYASYRPAASDDQKNWQINVKHSSGVTENFTVIIDDTTVIYKTANVFTGNLEAKGTYKGREVKLLVIFTPGFLGLGTGYQALVFVDNELAAKFKF